MVEPDDKMLDDEDFEDIPEDVPEEELEEQMSLEEKNGLDPDADLDDDDDDLDDGETDEPQPGPDDDDDEDEEEERTVPLDPLEAEEMEAVEANEPATMLVDEASEIKALRREEMALDLDNEGRRKDEFVCQSCFLVRNIVQQAYKRRKICIDCA